MFAALTKTEYVRDGQLLMRCINVVNLRMCVYVSICFGTDGGSDGSESCINRRWVSRHVAFLQSKYTAAHLSNCRCTDAQAKRALLSAKGDQGAAIQLQRKARRAKVMENRQRRAANKSDFSKTPPKRDGERNSRISLGAVRDAIANFHS